MQLLEESVDEIDVSGTIEKLTEDILEQIEA